MLWEVDTVAKYGGLAIAAAREATASGQNPRKVWNTLADEIFGEGRAKCCPRSAFLGLFGAGLVKGIPAKKYTRSPLSAGRAVQAVEILLGTPGRRYSEWELWRLVAGREGISHDQQMTVVLALWDENLILVPNAPRT